MSGNTNERNMREFRIELLDEEELNDAIQSASSVGVDLRVEPKPEVIEPISWILIGGAAIAAGKFLFDLFDKLKGGVLIDLRPNASKLVCRDKDIPFGWATVIAADGSVKIEIHDAPKDAAERLLSEIVDGAFSTAKQVASAAADALGPDRVKE
jgi:hypothetical protein